MLRLTVIFFGLILFPPYACRQEHKISGKKEMENIDLSGEWKVQFDPENKGFDNSAENSFTIKLPGSLAQNKLGIKTSVADTARLTPAFKYVGKAWYYKEIEIPEKWLDKNIELFLERVLWESKVYIDGKEYDTKDALGTPHIHKLGKLKPGKHLLAIRINNELIHNIGVKGHSYTEHTQTLWNGIVGRIELVSKNSINIKKVNLYPNIKKDEVRVKLLIPALSNVNSKVVCEFYDPQQKKSILTHEEILPPNQSDPDYQLTIPLHGGLKCWDEFSPHVYRLKTSLIIDGKLTDTQVTDFGLREISHDGTKILINGKPVFLRGNLDNVHFPLTGYPSCDEKDWERIFKIYKDYGLNHVRFHSWCPPEAAFKAADKLGIYIQAEAGVWIDGWMSDVKGLGKDPARDEFVKKEMDRVIETYGNHPSFVMFCTGNELGNADFIMLENWIKEAKKNDTRRLYAASTARTITNECDYSATHYIKDIGLVRGTIIPGTNWDYEQVYQPNRIPIIAHEIGQWPAYPDWKEIKKYKGVLKAKNMEIFRKQARKNGIEIQSRDFQLVSGALSQLLYKYEIESFLRTPSCAGIQLLGINDYPGQGEALIGLLDCFWESKNITRPEKFKQHFSNTVPLLRFKKYVWTNNEIFIAKAEIAHHGSKDIDNAIVVFTIENEMGEICQQGKFDKKNIKRGTVTSLGKIKFSLSKILKAEKLTVRLSLKNSKFQNEWNVWTYPEVLPEVDMDEKILIAGRFNETIIKELEKGKKVLLNASALGTDKTSVNANFYSVFWSLTYFPGQGKTNIGLLVNEKHPCFENFPTDFHSDWQWESISEKAKGFIINDLPHGYRAIAQPVDDFHRNNKIGAIMEFKVGKGKLLISGYDFSNDTLPVAGQLEYSLIKYMASDHFNPQTSIKIDWLRNLFGEKPDENKLELPEKYKNALLYVKILGNVKGEGINRWEKKNDFSVLQTGTDYFLENTMEDTAGRKGNPVELNIKCPKGILGTCHIKVKGLKSTNISIDFEGRKENQTLNKDEAGNLKYHIMREDSQDGDLKLKFKGSHFEIKEIAILANE